MMTSKREELVADDPRKKRKKTISERIDHGKKFERELSDAARDMKIVTRWPVLWERVMDSAGAGRVIRKADADFKLTVKSADHGRPYLFNIECKASTETETFAKGFRSLIKSDQSAKMRIAHRAGVIGIYLFKDAIHNMIEVWYSKVIDEAYPLKRQPLLKEPAWRVSLSNLPFVLREMCTEPDKFIDRLRRSEA